jgi:citrate lyase beta subunit
MQAPRRGREPRSKAMLRPTRRPKQNGAGALHANDEVLVFAMVETREAVKNLDEIVSVEGLDGVYVGPSDLSRGLSMGGMVGQWLGANAPERIERLVLSNTSSYFPDETARNDRLKLVREKGIAAFFTKGFPRAFAGRRRVLARNVRRNPRSKATSP